jgi:hypothetical protein
MNEFIDYLWTPLGATSNYSATANLQHSQITTAPAKIFAACCVFNSRSLATASSGGDSSASRAHVITVRRISRNWTIVDCQLNYSAISSQPPLQSSTQLPAFNWTPQPASDLLYIASGRTQQKTPTPIVSVVFLGGCLIIARMSFPRELVFMEPLPSNTYCFSWLLHSNGTTHYNTYTICIRRRFIIMTVYSVCAYVFCSL